MKNITSKLILLLFTINILSSCNSPVEDLSKLPTFDANNTLLAVIEIPAGTNKKIEYNKETLTFDVDQRDGKDRIIKYLPYFGNYGFIPSTLSDKTKGGDGDPLDILVLAESVPTGTIMEVIPIGILNIRDEGEEDDKIIAVPKDPKLRTIDVDNFEDWKSGYVNTQRIIITWYRNYDKGNTNVINGFRNEKIARDVIEKWRL